MRRLAYAHAIWWQTDPEVWKVLGIQIVLLSRKISKHRTGVPGLRKNVCNMSFD